MQLDDVAVKFQESGISSLVYDHRNTGASDGLPRNEINPHLQCEDYHEAVTLLTTFPEVDTSKIAVWGFSLSGGHAVKAAATDRRIKAIITIGPALNPTQIVKRSIPRHLRSAVDASLLADRAARIKGEEIAYGLVTSVDPSIQSFLPTPDAAAWLFGFKTRAPVWENKYTVQSMFHLLSHCPAGFIETLCPTPWLLIQGDDDNMCPPDTVLDTYHQAKEPKELMMYAGGHFTTFSDEKVFEKTMATQIEFLKRRLNF